MVGAPVVDPCRSRSSQSNQVRADHVVYEVKDCSDEKAEILVQPGEPLVRIEGRKASLQGQNEENDGADRGH